MSEATRGRDWLLYVTDMLAFAEKVQTYTRDLDQAAFVADQRTFDATLRNLELIDEAAAHVPDTVRADHPEIPWRLVIATRNRLIHAYLGLDNDTLWSIVQDDIPALITALHALTKER